MPKRSLSNVFKSSEGLLQLYRNGQLDSIIDKFSDIITEANHLGGSKCSTFLMPDKKHVFKLTLKDIGYFKKGYCADFIKQLNHEEINDVHFFRKHINSMGEYFASVKKILYHDENIFIYIQDCCIPLRHYKNKLPSNLLGGNIVIQILQFIQYMIEKDVLVTEIGPGNLGIFQPSKHDLPKLVIFDYDTVKPLRETMRINIHRWWGFQLGSLLNYLSHIFKPNKSKWYYSQRHKWGKSLEAFESAKKDFPNCVYALIESYTRPLSTNEQDIESQLNKIIFNLGQCITEIKKHK